MIIIWIVLENLEIKYQLWCSFMQKLEATRTVIKSKRYPLILIWVKIKSTSGSGTQNRKMKRITVKWKKTEAVPCVYLHWMCMGNKWLPTRMEVAIHSLLSKSDLLLNCKRKTRIKKKNLNPLQKYLGSMWINWQKESWPMKAQMVDAK